MAVQLYHVYVVVQNRNYLVEMHDVVKGLATEESIQIQTRIAFSHLVPSIIMIVVL